MCIDFTIDCSTWYYAMCKMIICIGITWAKNTISLILIHPNSSKADYLRILSLWFAQRCIWIKTRPATGKNSMFVLVWHATGFLLQKHLKSNSSYLTQWDFYVGQPNFHFFFQATKPMVKWSMASGQSSRGVWVENRDEIWYFFFQIFQNCSNFSTIFVN